MQEQLELRRAAGMFGGEREGQVDVRVLRGPARIATADTTLEGQPALFLTGYISPTFTHFSAVLLLFSPS